MLDLKSISNRKDHIFFKTKRSFMEWVRGEGVDLDLNKSLTAYRHTVYIKDERIFNANLNSLIKVLNQHLPEESKLCDKKSRVKGKNSYLVFLSNVESASVVVVDPVAEDASVLEDEVLLDLEEFSEEKDSPDWDLVDEMYDDSDKAGSKNKLEEYARQWNIELAKNKSYANMVKDFKESL